MKRLMLISPVVVLFVGLLAFEHPAQPQLAGLCPADRQIAVGESCGNKVDDDTEEYCTVTDPHGCPTTETYADVKCSKGYTHCMYGPMKIGCQYPESRAACTKHDGAKMADESGNYKKVPGAEGSCGTWDGYQCKTTSTLKEEDCEHGGTIKHVEVSCGEDETKEKWGNCDGVVQNAGAC
jgi:hypothetical protein